MPVKWQSGTFVAPTLIELDDFAELQKEVFGPGAACGALQP